MTKKRNKQVRKRLATAAMSVLLIVTLTAGCAVAEYHTRRIGFGDGTPVASVQMQEDKLLLYINLFGHTGEFDVTLPARWAVGAAREAARLIQWVRTLL